MRPDMVSLNYTSKALLRCGAISTEDVTEPGTSSFCTASLRATAGPTAKALTRIRL
jgi:hypothetical protein